MSDSDVNLAAFEHGGLIMAKRLRQFHAHVGKTFSELRQERRQDTFDCLRWSSNLQHPALSPAQPLGALAERINMTQGAPTILKELLAFCSEDEAACEAVKKSKPEALFEIADLP